MDNYGTTPTEPAADMPKSRPMLLILGIAAGGLVLFLSGLFVGKMDFKNNPAATNSPSLIPSPQNTAAPIPTATVIPTVPLSLAPQTLKIPVYKTMALPELLKANCDSKEKIDTALLPFSFSPAALQKYSLASLAPCHFDFDNTRSGGYVRLEKRSATENLPEYTLKIGTGQSADGYYGEEDFPNFDKITPTLNIGGRQIVVDILSPGPYGLSSRGVWLDVSGYRKTGEYLTIAKSFRVIPAEGELLQLFEKYQDKREHEVEDPQFPAYTVNNKYKEFKKEFIDKYFIAYPNISPVYKEMVDSAIADLDSVSVKN